MANQSRWRVWAKPLIAAVALAVIPYGTTAAAPDAPVPSAASNAWGWLVARQPSTFAYVPAPPDQGNSGGNGDRVERVQLGDYYAIFDRIGNGSYPIGMVTALSAGARSCMIDDSFGKDVGGDPALEIDCFDKNGQPADARFVANIVLGGDGPTGTLGYTWADQEATADYTPDPYYSYLSSGAGPMSVHRDSIGSYQVTMPGLGRLGGNVQVVAAKGGPAARCKVLALVRNGSDELVRVRCRDVPGQLVDADFMVIFTDRVGLTGVPKRKAAYLLANRPAAASYQPIARYRYSSMGTIPTVTRTAVGRYRVTLPGMPQGGSAQVTAYGPGVSICQVTSIRTNGLPQRIEVACFDPNGAGVDSKFMLTYTR